MSATDNEVNGTEVPETTEETGNNGVVDVQIALPNKTVVQIPSVFVGESLASFKQALLDYQECAAFTCYNLHLRELVAQDGTKTEVDVACNDFTELASVMEPTTTSCMFELIPGEYNVKKVHDQLKRANDMMLNPPTTKGLINAPANKKKTDAKANDSKSSTTATDSKPAMPKTEDLFKNIEFGNFYGEVLYRTGNVEAVTQSGRMPQNKAVADAVKSVFASGWNPPPPQRKVRGDLLYIEVVTANEGTIYITAVPSGFYVNKCNRSHFDPSPATNHCFSHELFDTLLKVSPTLKAAWSTVVASARSASSTEAEPATPLDVTAWMFSQGRGHLTTEGAMPKVQWNAYNVEAYKNFVEGSEASARPSENAHHAYNLFRTQQDLTNLQGVEELGAPREWNDEIQSIRALKATDGSEKIMKAKLEYKVLSEFAAACRATAVAITEGLIAPLSLGDPSQSDIYVYNGIFFSKAEDSKDSFKICNGDEAYKKCTARELQNQRTIRSLEIEGVGMILCAIIDYKGQRIIGQSIIPGIFAQGENVARLMYGILDKEKLLTVKNSSLKVMQAVAEKLFIPTRNTKLYPFGEPAAAVEAASEEAKTAGMLDEAQTSPIKVDETDNVVAATATSTPHCGPIEGKVLRGSDGRDYVLEVMRLTPRDANYVAGEKGTGKVTTLDKTDKDLAVTYILRPELISIYVQRKMNMERQKIMMEAAAKQKQLLADKAPKAVEGAAAEATEGEKKETETPALDEETMRTLTEEYTAKMKEITVASLGLEVNPNCFLDFEFDVDAAVVKKDEDTARELATFLWDVVLPAVTKQVRDGDIQVRDNAAMVKLLHRNGVNMRYLGALLNLAVAEEKEDENLLAQGKQKVHAMPLFWREMLTVEVVARAVKYVLNSYFKQSAAVFSAPAQTVASVLNHVLSLLVPPATTAPVATEETNTTTEVSKKSKKKKGGKGVEPAVTAAVTTKVDEKALLFPVPDSATNCDDVLRLIQETVASRFCFDLPLSSTAPEAELESSKKFLQSRMSALPLLRRICQVCGIQIATRKYNFSTATPLAAADILGLYPIVKSCEPEVLLAEFSEMLDSSVNFQQEGNFAYAYEMAQQALGTITQITGPYHMHAAHAIDQVTNVLIAAGDFTAAEQYAQKGLAISTQLSGFDSQESAMHHMKLSILESELGNRTSALQHLLTAKYLLQLMTGERHTELANVYTRLAALYEEAGDFDSVWQCYLKAKYHTCDLMAISALNIALASACSRNGHPFEALELQKQAYTMLKELIGDRDESQLDEVKATLENYLRAVNEEKIASNQLVNERLKEMMEKANKLKLAPASDSTAAGNGQQLSDQELLDAFAEIDARAEKERKKAEKAARMAKKPSGKAKK